MSKENPVVRFFKWGAGALADNWFSGLFVIASGGAVTWLAKASAFMASYAPLSWASAGLLGALIVVSIMALYATYRSKKTLTEFEVRRAGTVGIDPRETEFTKKSIQLQDFFHPFFKPVLHVRFQDCDIFGPAIVLVGGSTFEYCKFKECDFVVLADEWESFTSTGFNRCNFLRCDFFRVMFLMPQQMVDKLR